LIKPFLLNSGRLSIQEYKDGILKSNRFTLAKAITLVESTRAEDQKIANELIDQILPYTGNSLRVGITGVPGVGKSTFIETFGTHITNEGKRLAILTVDPSSQLTKGSILGDKTRMDSLSKNQNAFIRPSASRDSLGGVASRTRESMLLCEAAGYDVIIVETVGVGQSEVAVKNMVDFFLLLMLAGAGDELQGIKKGIMEMADAVVITKADGDNVAKATQARADYQHALNFLRSGSLWKPKVLTCSALEQKGISDIWKVIGDFENKMKSSGYFDTWRKQQQLSWFRESFAHILQMEISKTATLSENRAALETQVVSGSISPMHAAEKLMDAYRQFVRFDSHS